MYIVRFKGYSNLNIDHKIILHTIYINKVINILFVTTTKHSGSKLNITKQSEKESVMFRFLSLNWWIFDQSDFVLSFETYKDT